MKFYNKGLRFRKSLVRSLGQQMYYDPGRICPRCQSKRITYDKNHELDKSKGGVRWYYCPYCGFHFGIFALE